MIKIINELGLKQDKAAKTESYFCDHDKNLLISTDHINELKQRLIDSKKDSIRISLHKNPDDIFHQMIIVHRQGGNFKPHKHPLKEEAHHLIDGKLIIQIYNDAGEVVESIRLGDPSTGLPFMFRLRRNTWHATIPESDFVVFHESKSGPFDSVDSIYL